MSENQQEKRIRRADLRNLHPREESPAPRRSAGEVTVRRAVTSEPEQRDNAGVDGFLGVAPRSWLEYFSEWLTGSQHSLLSLSFIRIIFGSLMLGVLVTNFKDRQYIWGEASRWIDPLHTGLQSELLLNVFSKTDPAVFDTVYFITIAVAVLFTVGLFTRVVTPVLLFLWVSLSANNPLLLNGGDVALRITLLFLIFANLSEHVSLDRALRGSLKFLAIGTAEYKKRYYRIFNALHNTAIILVLYQTVLIYFNSGLLKLSGAEWLQGSAVYYALSLDTFMPFPELSEMLRLISPFVWVGTWVALWTQFLFPALIAWRKTRFYTVFTLSIMHTAIAIIMGLWAFSALMLGLLLLFIRDRDWRSLGSKKKQREEADRAEQEPGIRRGTSRGRYAD